MTIKELKENPVKLIADDWALVSAGTPEKWNTLTVSWGGIGELWGRDVAFILYVRRDIQRNSLMSRIILQSVSLTPNTRICFAFAEESRAGTAIK